MDSQVLLVPEEENLLEPGKEIFFPTEIGVFISFIDFKICGSYINLLKQSKTGLDVYLLHSPLLPNTQISIFMNNPGFYAYLTIN